MYKYEVVVFLSNMESLHLFDITLDVDENKFNTPAI